MNLRSKKLLKPKSRGELPFVEGHEKLNNIESLEHQVKDPLSSIVPANKENLEIAEAYRAALPNLLKRRIPEVRDFFLKEIAPINLGFSNGLQDAEEILSAALDEQVDVSGFASRLESLVLLGIEVKMVSFVKGLLKLDEEESKRFLISVFAKEIKNEDLATVLSQLLKKSDVERSVEKQPTRQRRSRR